MSIVHIPFYPSDWLGGTRNLSDAETGVYITLLAHMYEMAGPIEREDNRLYRMCGCRSKASFVNALEYLISQGKITSDERGLFNDRVQKEIQKVTEKSSSARAAAQSRWDKKGNKNKGTSDANASHPHMRNGCQPKPKPEPKSKRDTNVSPKKPDWPDFISPEVAKGYEQHRIAKKAKLTPRAITLLSKTLHQIRDAGMDPNAALDLAIERGWQGLKFEWVEREFSGPPERGWNEPTPRETYADENRRVLGGGPDAAPGDFLDQPNVYQIARAV